VSYRALKLRFQLDDEALAALTDELIYAERVARDEDDRVLVWVGEAGATAEPSGQASRPLPLDTARVEPRHADAERRQLTVLFCDLVTRRCSPANSTRKSGARWYRPIKRPAPK
jgi:hypothetical protein